MKKEEKEYLSNLLKKSSYNVLTMKEILKLLEVELNEKELEAYLQELSTDVTEMIKDASPEEKARLRQKMTTLASKIA